MVPNHLLNNLTADDRIAILSRGGEIHFLVHAVSDGADVIEAHAAREGSQVLATHMKDHQEILDYVRSRERDIGGEG